MAFEQLMLALTGMGVGIIIGMIGVGGGSLMTPLLIGPFKLATNLAITTDLVFAFLVKSFATYFHNRHGSIDYHALVYVGGAGALGALGGSLLFSYLHGYYPETFEANIRIAIGSLLVFSAIINIFFFIKKSNRLQFSLKFLDNKAGKLVLGFLVGAVVALTSVGAGAIVVILLMQVWRVPIDKIVGTDLAIALMIIGIASVSHLMVSAVEMSVIAPLVGGGIIGSYVGEKIHTKMPNQALKYLVTVVIGVVGVNLMVH